MELISSRGAIDFLSQAAPRAWVKKLLFALIVDQELLAFATGGRSVARAMAGRVVLDTTGEVTINSQVRKQLEKAFSPELVATLCQADHRDLVDDIADEWDTSMEPRNIEPGFFLFAIRTDWEGGIVEAEVGDVGRFDGEFFDRKSSVFQTGFRTATFHVTFTGLSFSWEAIEMLLPSAQRALSREVGSEIVTRSGRPRVWDWDGALLHLMKIAQTPDGLPNSNNAQAEIEKLIAEWFIERTGNSPAESSIRSYADKVMRSLGLKA